MFELTRCSVPACGIRPHSVFRNIEPFPSSSLTRGAMSRDAAIHTQTNYATTPSSPPNSPPPSYTSVIKSNQQQSDTSTEATTNGYSSRIPLQTDLCAGGPFDGNGRDDKQPQFRAYEYSQEEVLLPEMDGDTVWMSGTNAQGPVNPFEFSAPSSTPQPASTSKYTNTNEVAELLGDLHFADEQAACSPGPPPGYPARPANTSRPASHSPHVWPSHDTYSHGHTMSLPELPAVTRCRPAATHAATDLGPMLRHEEVPDSAAPSLNVSSERRARSYASELPAPSRQPHFSCNSYDYSNNAHHPQHRPTPFASTPAVTANRSALSQQHHGYHRSQQTAADFAHPSIHRPLSQAPITSSSARMQRQKDMLHLLGSLGS